MPETIKTKKLTDLAEKTEIADSDIFAVGNSGTSSMRRVSWGTIWNKILSKIRETLFANNLTTNTEGYGMDARQGPVIDKKISDVKSSVDELNTNMIVTGAFSGSWLPGFMINGMGFTVIIPKHYKAHTLTISSAKIFTPGSKTWTSTTVSSIADLVNCWRVILKTEASMELTSGYAYIADLSGQIK